MSIGFFLREALRSMQRNAVPSFAAMVAVLMTVLVLGAFIPFVQAATGAANDVRNKVLVEVYLKSNASKADIARVQQLLTDRTPHVKSVEFVSKQTALAQQSAKNPDAYHVLGYNPLPDAFRVTPDNPDDVNAVLAALTPTSASGGPAVIDPSIDVVKNRKDETKKILTVTRFVKLTMGGLALLLVLASILLISNTLRLSMFSRRREVEVMKLVGATDWFIRWPFMIEGVLLGALGGVVAILLLAVVKVALIDGFAGDFALLSATKTINFGVLIAILLGASVAVSAAGSGLSLRRFLRV